jgi:hypothetical protein
VLLFIKSIFLFGIFRFSSTAFMVADAWSVDRIWPS